MRTNIRHYASPDNKALRFVITLAAAFLALPIGVSCSGNGEEASETGPNIVQPGAPGEPATTLSEDDLETIETPDYGDADVAFMQGMIAHHQQALDMVELVPGRRERKEIAILAKRIRLSQESEIDLLEDWLTERGEDTAHQGHHLMPGMLTPAELGELRAASGDRFDRLFLEYMITHHQGALTMVAQLAAAGGAIEPQSYDVSTNIGADQRIEIKRMEELLATL